MCRVLIIGAGGVGTVVAHKVAANPVFTDVMLASRTKSKCDVIAADVKKRYQQLSDADLEMVAAAGEVSLPILITGDTDNGKL